MTDGSSRAPPLFSPATSACGGTLDIDLYREAEREAAENDLRLAAAADIGDWFAFEVGGRSAITNNAVRLPIDARIGATTWLAFHVDLVGSDARMTGQAEEVPPLAPGVIPFLQQHQYRAYPLIDHIADKIAATYEGHGGSARPSTRYRDLVDLVAIVSQATVPADAQSLALRSEFARRALPLPSHFDIPDRQLWESGYAAEARRSLLNNERTLDKALAVVRPFVDPLLDGTATGSWDPRSQGWIPR